MVGLTAESFTTVESYSGETAKLLHEAAEASGEQSRSIGDINDSMTDIGRVTHSNASAAGESARSARSRRQPSSPQWRI